LKPDDHHNTGGWEDREEDAEHSAAGLLPDILEDCAERIAPSTTYSPEYRKVNELESTAALSRTLLSWQVLSALILACGTVRFTTSDYQSFRRYVNWLLDGSRKWERSLPSYTTLREVIVRTVREHAWARSLDKRFRINTLRSGVRCSSEIVRTAPVRIVLPSSWARLDVMTGSIYDCITGKHDITGPAPLFSSIEDTPIVKDRRACIAADERAHFGTDCAWSIPMPASRNEEIEVCAASSLKLVNILQECGIMDSVSEDSERLSFRARAGALWMFKIGSLEQSAASTMSSLQDSESFLPDVLRVLIDVGVPDFKLCRPGDLVMHLRFSGSGFISRAIFLLIFHFQTRADDLSRQNLTIIEGCNLEKATRIIGTVTNFTLLDAKLIPDMQGPLEHYAPQIGRLSDGRRYLVYRMLLYCDDFQPFTTRKGSAGGCYMLPLGVPPSHRSGCGAVRILGLTPPGVSTSEILAELIPDILQGTTEGFLLRDADGDCITVFLDVIGFIGDYPAITHALDTLGHNACAPCHLCVFQRDEGIETGGSRYGYTTDAHARSSAFVRTLARVQAARDGKGRGAEEGRFREMRVLGLKQNTAELPLPLHRLSEALRLARDRVPLTEHGVPVVPALFDPYQSCFVAPDHLLSGLAIDAINAVIAAVSSDVRSVAESIIRDAIAQSCLLRSQNRIFGSSPPSLLSMTISDVFAVLLVAPQAFKSANAILRTKCVKSSRKRARVHPALAEDLIALLQQYKDLVTAAHFLPAADVDGKHAVFAFNHLQGMRRIGGLYALAREYVRALNRMCMASDEARKHLDKPNVHRLLELFVHTLPAFGHLHHVQELIFETAHQPLKRAIRGSNYRQEQLFAVSAALASDWESRIAVEVELALESGERWDDYACLRIERLITGDAQLRKSSLDASSVQEVFVPPLVAELSAVRRRHCKSISSRAYWVLHERETYEAPARRALWLSEMFSAALQWYSSQGSEEHNSFLIDEFNRASRFRRSALSANGKRTYVRRASVSSGCVLHVPCVRNDTGALGFLRTEADSDARNCLSSFWYVICFIQNNDGTSGACTVELEEVEQITLATQPIAVVLPCEHRHVEGNECIIRVVRDQGPSLLRLSHCVRETLLMHVCTQECFITSCSAKNEIVHSASLEDGGEYVVYGRLQGYPPRSA
jgi:hypothetical protein